MAMAWFFLKLFEQHQPLDPMLSPSEENVGFSLLIPTHMPLCIRGFHVPPRSRHCRPPNSLTQPECWDLIERSPIRFARRGCRLKTAAPHFDGDFWLVSFGAGFCAHSCRLGVEKI